MSNIQSTYKAWYTVFIIYYVYECIAPQCKQNINLKSYIFAHKKWQSAGTRNTIEGRIM